MFLPVFSLRERTCASGLLAFKFCCTSYLSYPVRWQVIALSTLLTALQCSISCAVVLWPELLRNILTASDPTYELLWRFCSISRAHLRLFSSAFFYCSREDLEQRSNPRSLLSPSKGSAHTHSKQGVTVVNNGNRPGLTAFSSVFGETFFFLVLEAFWRNARNRRFSRGDHHNTICANSR